VRRLQADDAQTTLATVLAKARFWEAIAGITINERQRLVINRLLNDGVPRIRAKLSTNLAENSMRPVALGRKNWLHLGSPQAGPNVVAIPSVVESCRRLKVPVRHYLSAILPGLPISPSAAFQTYSRCVGRPAFIDSSDRVLAGARMALYRELSCDESVIQRAHGAELVSALAKLALPERGLPLQAAASSHLSYRLARLARPTQTTNPAATMLLTSLFAIVMAAAIFQTVAHTACCFVLKR
jgi:hypothetical protein